MLKINERCSCEAEAQILARSRLREANKREVSGSISSLGNPGIRAGLTASVKGWGKLDASTYFIEEARHRVDKQGGYETAAEIRGVIGY